MVCVVAVLAGQAAAEDDALAQVARDYMTTFRRLRDYLSVDADEEEDWSMSVRRAAFESIDLVPEEAFGLDIAHRDDTVDECHAIGLSQFAEIARREMMCGNASFCNADEGVRLCPAEGAVDETGLRAMLDAGALDCYVPVHIVPPDSPELEAGCDVDIVANMAVVHAGWALEHTIGGSADLAGVSWRDGVSPPDRPTPTRHARAHARFARELAVVGGVVPVMEARRAIVECGVCHVNHEGARRMAEMTPRETSHDEL